MMNVRIIQFIKSAILALELEGPKNQTCIFSVYVTEKNTTHQQVITVTSYAFSTHHHSITLFSQKHNCPYEAIEIKTKNKITQKQIILRYIL